MFKIIQALWSFSSILYNKLLPPASGIWQRSARTQPELATSKSTSFGDGRFCQQILTCDTQSRPLDPPNPNLDRNADKTDFNPVSSRFCDQRQWNAENVWKRERRQMRCIWFALKQRRPWARSYSPAVRPATSTHPGQVFAQGWSKENGLGFLELAVV